MKQIFFLLLLVNQLPISLDAKGNWDSVTKDGLLENRTHNEVNEVMTAGSQNLSYDDIIAKVEADNSVLY